MVSYLMLSYLEATQLVCKHSLFPDVWLVKDITRHKAVTSVWPYDISRSVRCDSRMLRCLDSLPMSSLGKWTICVASSGGSRLEMHLTSRVRSGPGAEAGRKFLYSDLLGA